MLFKGREDQRDLSPTVLSSHAMSVVASSSQNKKQGFAVLEKMMMHLPFCNFLCQN